MSQKMDPEELKEVMSLIFGEIAQIVTKYEGFIEKFIGDAVMAVFGVPKAHEDDPMRAIRAAREIHEKVQEFSPEIRARTGQPVFMHTGIDTGLVVTGEVSRGKGTHGIIGETFNLASRLGDLAAAGEILVGVDTYHHASGYFNFHEREPVRLDGRLEPVRIYKVISPKEQPTKTHRAHGLRSRLIGREREIAQLQHALDVLKNGKGAVFSIYGSAGTGKSRLVEEFRRGLDFEEIQWLEGHSYPYAKNIPYSPVIDMFGRAFQIKENDSPDNIKNKIGLRIRELAPDHSEIIPYIGSLFNLEYPGEIEENISPEFWKSRLHEAVKIIIASFAQKGPTVICLEDLHWTDPSFLELVRSILKEFKDPILILCIYRPTLKLFAPPHTAPPADSFREIELKDLSRSETESMVESLLGTKDIPPDFRRFVNEKVDGNPFYLEEVVNALIDSNTLVRENGGWKLMRQISAASISSSIREVITARVDNLGEDTKRILQEASVIGRTFLKEILLNITELKESLNDALNTLERLDLIKSNAGQPNAVYAFKHALIQEVVYNSLVRKQRQAIHERIGITLETLFRQRISEFYETLAYHFTQARSTLKAVTYLMQSGQKTLRKFAVEEAHLYYQKAYENLNPRWIREKHQIEVLLDLLNEWALVYYYRGDFKGMERLLKDNLSTADSFGDKSRSGVLYAWLGFALFCREKNRESYQMLQTALACGQDTGQDVVKGCACTWLTWTCSELGYYSQGLQYGRMAQDIAESLESEPHIYFQSLSGMGEIYFFLGEVKKIFKIGRRMLDFGHLHSNSRSIVNGYIALGHGHMNCGNYATALENYYKAFQNAQDPFYQQWPKFFIGMSRILQDQFEEAEKPLQEVLAYSREFGCEALGTGAQGLLALISISRGEFVRGMKTIQSVAQTIEIRGRLWVSAMLELIQASIYMRLYRRKERLPLPVLFRNLGFLIKTIPHAAQKAEMHLNRAIAMTRELDAKNLLGQAHLELGRLFLFRNRLEQAREHVDEAYRFFEICDATMYLEQAKDMQKHLN